jgi:hypothetical protein
MAIEIDGREYPINADFRSCLRIIMAFEDPELANIEKQIILLENLYQTRPENIQVALEKGVRFLDCRELHDGNDDGDAGGPRVYSFSKDAQLIFAAFRQTHGVDLSIADLHWWVFYTLFMDLGSDTAFCNLISLRHRVKTGKATKEERATAREMGEAFDIPEIDDRTLAEREREDEFMRLVKASS